MSEVKSLFICLVLQIGTELETYNSQQSNDLASDDICGTRNWCAVAGCMVTLFQCCYIPRRNCILCGLSFVLAVTGSVALSVWAGSCKVRDMQIVVSWDLVVLVHAVLCVGMCNAAVRSGYHTQNRVQSCTKVLGMQGGHSLCAEGMTCVH